MQNLKSSFPRIVLKSIQNGHEQSHIWKKRCKFSCLEIVKTCFTNMNWASVICWSLFEKNFLIDPFQIFFSPFNLIHDSTKIVAQYKKFWNLGNIYWNEFTAGNEKCIDSNIVSL